MRDNRIESDDGKIIGISSGANNKISNLYFTQTENKKYTIFARDRKDNTTKETIDLTINAPRITIDQIQEIKDDAKIIYSSLEE